MVQSLSSHRVGIDKNERYVSRAAYKLESVADSLKLDFSNKVVIDVGSSTGGFTDYALAHGAIKVVAVEKGTNQISPLLLGNPRIELHEKTDIRNFNTNLMADLILIDVSFVSLRDILPDIVRLSSKKTLIIAMAKPQFETKLDNQKNQGVIKNERIRREILNDLELGLKQRFVLLAKADSKISGLKGNKERFYKLTIKY